MCLLLSRASTRAEGGFALRIKRPGPAGPRCLRRTRAGAGAARKAFDSAVAGHGGLVMLVGEPGIGKTRTTPGTGNVRPDARRAGAVGPHARGGGRARRTGRGFRPASSTRSPTSMTLAEVVGVNMPPGAANELTRIFPWLRGQPNIGEPEPQSDPEVAQFRLFDAYASYIRAIAMNRPLVIALDDLHWADKPTLMMLQHIARELARMPVLDHRQLPRHRHQPPERFSETLATLNRETGFERILLRGLTRDEVGAYIRARANVEPRPEVLDKIFEETEGNAFFLSEVVNLMAQEGTLTRSPSPISRSPTASARRSAAALTASARKRTSCSRSLPSSGATLRTTLLTLLGDRDEDELLQAHRRGVGRACHRGDGDRLGAIASRTRRCRRRSSPSFRPPDACACTARWVRRWRNGTEPAPKNAPAGSRCTSARRRRSRRGFRRKRRAIGAGRAAGPLPIRVSRSGAAFRGCPGSARGSGDRRRYGRTSGRPREVCSAKRGLARSLAKR